MEKVFFAKIIDGRLFFENETEKKWADFAFKVKDGMNVHIEVKTFPERNMEVLQQRRYYRGVIVPIFAFEMGYEKEEMHQLLAGMFLAYEKRGKSGKVQKFMKSTADGEMDTVEFTEFIEKLLELGREYNIRIPTPEEIENNPSVLKEILRTKQNEYATLEDFLEIFGKK